MDIRQLRYFIAIVEQGSFSRAAQILHIAQPALSLHVRNIEADLGTQLLFRSPQGVVPTEAGEILLRNARIILDQLVVAEEEIRGHRNDPSGVVRLGLPGTVSEILSVPLITEARRRYPKIQLRIAEAMSGFVLEWMRDARIDLAVIYRKVSDAGLATVELLEEELVFFAPRRGLGEEIALPPSGKPLRLADVAGLPMILPGEDHGLRSLLDQHARAARVEMNVSIEVDSYSNIKELVAAGFGCSVLPLNAVSREVQAGSLRSWSITDPPIRRSVHLASSVERPMTNAVAAIRDLVRELLHELSENGRWAGATAVRESRSDSKGVV
ncbi:LysR family nitrogen assimilation transcriptional regulator [Aquamicrobium lusatiense]|uniref:LysR family nitrogen assimilation transcriptional regulator n=1 Tax=Aquamicrobium lusatiense TaxID=89772 RepID=A0A7W9S4W5_9HYPH|nr:LysR substrate-binding domain-containing protein [Aquamicrobium lusatiense]MBB6013824.1 LysR family nitrogen assimilation transcriptional regulator [Aquamicrobium lusatiense]